MLRTLTLRASYMEPDFAPEIRGSLAGRVLRLHLSAHPFHFAKHAHQVPAENFVNVLLIVAAFEKTLGDLRQVRRRVHSFGRRTADPIKIRSQADMVDSRHFGDVVDVV